MLKILETFSKITVKQTLSKKLYVEVFLLEIFFQKMILK